MIGAGHILVTGGGSGIGRAIAEAFGHAGWTVTLVGRDPARLDVVKLALPKSQARVCDVTQEDGVRAVLAEAAREFGPVDVLVNCAGSVVTAPFEKMPPAVWNDLWSVNVLGAVHMCQAVLPAMKAAGRGRIVNIASTASLKGYAYTSAYTAAKHGLLGMTRALALELATTGITVNAVCPGYADTDIIRDAVRTIMDKTGRSEAEALATFTGTNPQGRLVDPAEVAAAVLWLVSEGAGAVTGQAITIAGGEIM